MPETLSWLTACPIAHRGLHDRGAGRMENTLSAAAAAVAAGFAIECDVQLSADGEAMVFHDVTLQRLTGREGRVDQRSARELSALQVGGTADLIPTLQSLLSSIDGHVPLVCEIKSEFDGDMRLTDRVLTVLAPYSGRVALKSFDPAVLVHLRRSERAQDWPLGIVAEAHYDHPEWDFLTPARKADLAALAHFGETQPDFLSYYVEDLPHAAPALFRGGLNRPVVTWTVRTEEQRGKAALWADQMVFEGFVP